MPSFSRFLLCLSFTLFLAQGCVLQQAPPPRSSPPPEQGVNPGSGQTAHGTTDQALPTSDPKTGPLHAGPAPVGADADVEIQDLQREVRALNERIEALEEKLLRLQEAGDARPLHGDDAEQKGTGAISALPAQSAPEREYAAALDKLLVQRDSQGAALAFEGFVARYPSHPLYPAGVYWLAESLLQSGQNERAALMFKEFLNGYSNHPKAPDAYLGLGDAYRAFGDTTRAAENYRKVVQRFPGSGAAVQARLRLEEISPAGGDLPPNPIAPAASPSPSGPASGGSTP